MTFKVDEQFARKVLTTLDAGLVHGVGNPVPGEMCIMAAINHAAGMPHGDNPSFCVGSAVRALAHKTAHTAAAAAAAAAAARDKILCMTADIATETLQELDCPGCAWLFLCDQ